MTIFEYITEKQTPQLSRPAKKVDPAAKMREILRDELGRAFDIVEAEESAAEALAESAAQDTPTQPETEAETEAENITQTEGDQDDEKENRAQE